MTVVVITPPESLIDLAVVKLHLRVDGDDEDALIAAYFAAAQGHIDGPEGWLGRSLGAQVLELSLHGSEWAAQDWPRALPFGPVLEVASIHYDDADGVDQLLDPSTWSVNAAGRLGLAYGAAWPAVRSSEDAVRIRYSAGYDTLPPAIHAALLLLTGDLYANRETAVTGTIAAAVPMSASVTNLLSPYRTWSA